jgi:hypothetical protein
MPKKKSKIEKIFKFVLSKSRFERVVILLFIIILGSYFLFVFEWTCSSRRIKAGGDPIDVKINLGDKKK